MAYLRHHPQWPPPKSSIFIIRYLYVTSTGIVFSQTKHTIVNDKGGDESPILYLGISFDVITRQVDKMAAYMSRIVLAFFLVVVSVFCQQNEPIHCCFDTQSTSVESK